MQEKKPPMLNDLPEEEQQRLLQENEAEFDDTIKREELEASVAEIEKSQDQIDNEARHAARVEAMKEAEGFTISRKQAKRMGMYVPPLREKVRHDKITKTKRRKADKLARKQRRINRLRAA